MSKTIIHVDMDAFFAAVEVRDEPSLKGKPLIIGALPQERGVVATCSYEARRFGVHSAMSSREAFRRCPGAVFMHPDMKKYQEASAQIRRIWLSFTDAVECVSLDEGYLDVTGSLSIFGSALNIGHTIKKRILEEVLLTCSVGIGYSMMSAKLASEEQKPDGFFEIPNADALRKIIYNRSARIISGVGSKTAETLRAAGIDTVSDILAHKETVITLLGNQGRQIILLAEGRDERAVTPFYEYAAKSLSKEHTFQRDIRDYERLTDALRLLARDLSRSLRMDGIFARTVSLKIKYADMKLITRSKSGSPINRANDLFKIAAALLQETPRTEAAIRLIGISLGNLTDTNEKQLTLDDVGKTDAARSAALDKTLLELELAFGAGIIKTGGEMIAERRFNEEY